MIEEIARPRLLGDRRKPRGRRRLVDRRAKIAGDTAETTREILQLQQAAVT